MLDLRKIRENPQEMQERLRKKDPSISLDEIVALDEKVRVMAIEADELKNKRNVVSKEISTLKEKDVRDEKIKEMKEVSESIKKYDEELRILEEELRNKLLYLPNAPHDSVPVSDDEEDKIIVRSHLDKPEFDFEIKNHLELGNNAGMFDFERGAKTSQSMFSMYRGVGSRLEWALINYLMNFLTREKGFELIIPPLLVSTETMYMSGNLPKFGEQLYKCADDDLYLIPTSEVPLASMHRGEILKEEELPIYYCAYTPCFRREAGAHGKEERGLIRVHQFNKVEMFKYVKPETSYDELEHLVSTAEDLIKGLGLHFRTALLVTTDIAQQSAKTYDIECWLPGQGQYYEVSSCSNCEDFQARRGGIRYRDADSKKTNYVHTLNGSGLATSRLMVSLIETYQQADGSIVIPEVLRDYMGGQEKIEPKA
ncbi:MAG TPA: serine--tRNA ligase [bacterium]|nr:serine--tRNA ligase [bacterium]